MNDQQPYRKRRPENERVQHADASAALQDSIDRFYNRQWRHARFGDVPPALFAGTFSKQRGRLETRVSAMGSTPHSSDAGQSGASANNDI
ncbi:hypothetical protein [Janthinobacterium agaricidamnosum]|uniref:hypothetical protein n=1 Tax=Janthinobacterium agaricidamnosum TaxID=55508 RepID=UPI000571F335|nr:hypothetical protein [Janthinobacterium agaricidamnosum]